MENNGKGIFYGVIGVATLIVAIIGATFAYFSASATNNTTIAGNTASGNSVSLEISKLSTSATGDLIPMKDKDVQQGITGIDNSCVDSNGNTVCQVYKITVKNTGTTAVNVKGTMTLTSTATNMKWQLMQDNATLGSAGTAQNQGSEGTIVENQQLVASTGTQDYYVVIWLHETDAPQDTDDAGKDFNGSVTFNAVNADGGSTTGITANFGA